MTWKMNEDLIDGWKWFDGSEYNYSNWEVKQKGVVRRIVLKLKEVDCTTKVGMIFHVISCFHPTNINYIIPIDYRKIDKTAIHRLFSLKRPKCGRVPRLFVLDCCSGTQDKECKFRDSVDGNDKMITNSTTNTIPVKDPQQKSQLVQEQKDQNKAPDLELDKRISIGTDDGGWY